MRPCRRDHRTTPDAAPGAPISEYYPMRRIEERLGFRPECDFGRWLEELRARPEERAATTSTPWP